MTYTNRTCNKCGIRKPQPEMVKKSELAVAASTNFNRKNSTRVYGRPKIVWYCQECDSARSERRWRFVSVVIVGLFIWAVVDEIRPLIGG